MTLEQFANILAFGFRRLEKSNMTLNRLVACMHCAIIERAVALEKQYDRLMLLYTPTRSNEACAVLNANSCCVVYINVTLHCQKPCLAVLRTKVVKMMYHVLVLYHDSRRLTARLHCMEL